MARKKGFLFYAGFILGIFAASPVHAGLFAHPGEKALEKLLRSPAAASANIGVKVVSLHSGKTLFAHQNNKLFVPASTVKLITAYGALKVLGPSYSFPVEMSTDQWKSSSTIHHLFVKGYGDPTVVTADLNYEALTLSDRVKRITGDIVIDTTYFDSLQFGKGWMWDEGIVHWNAPVSPYIINGNCIEITLSTGATLGARVRAQLQPRSAYSTVVSNAVTAEEDALEIKRDESETGDYYIITGSMSAHTAMTSYRCTVSRPGLYAGTLLKEMLQRYGVKVDGRVYEMRAGTAPVSIERFQSRSLTEILRTFLRESTNSTGESLLKAMGAFRFSAPGDAAKGITVLQKQLKDIGIAEERYRLADGSGLSTYNQLSPDVLVTVLEKAYNDLSCFPEFMEALPVAGRDGTLKGRMHDTPVEGALRAKTGTMSGVSCISGYLKTKKGSLLAVSILMNGCVGPVKPLQDVQDEMLRILWEHY